MDRSVSLCRSIHSVDCVSLDFVQISVEGQYFIRGLLFELGALQYSLQRVPMPRRKQGLVVLPRSPDVEISIKRSGGGMGRMGNSYMMDTCMSCICVGQIFVVVFCGRS